MIAAGTTVRGAADRLRARSRRRHDDYALCPEDGHWFRPAYTAGTCPLCGTAAPGGAPPRRLLLRIDRSWYGLASFTLVSLGMSILVLVMYFQG